MRAKNAAFRLLEEALDIASHGVDGAEVALFGGTLGATRFAENEVHQSTEVSRDVVSVRVLKGGRFGRVETTDITREGLDDALRRARMFAQFLPAPKEPGELPDKQTYPAIAESFDRPTDRAAAVDRMAPVSRALLVANRRGLASAGVCETRSGPISGEAEPEGPYAIMNTRGLEAYHYGTRSRLSVTFARPDGVSGWAETSAIAIGDLESQAAIDAAARKALVKGELRAAGPMRCPVVLEPAAVATLLKFLATSSGAADVARGESYLCDRIGSKALAEKVTIEDDFGHPLHAGAPFDSEGISRRKVLLVDRGTIRGPLYGLESARREGKEPTGHRAVHPIYGDREIAEHLVMHGGDSTVGDLIGGLESGLVITRLWYVRLVDPRTLTLTGMTRDGTFLVEKGEIVHPVKSLRFNVSLLDLLGRVSGLSRAVYSQGVVAPGLRVDDFAFTSSEG